MRVSRAAMSALGLACTAAVVWGATAAWQSATQSRQARVLEDLVQRCTQQMVRDTCRVMQAPTASPVGARLFIAGVGEVDAAAFAALRSYGDAMCREVGTQCAADWGSRSCQIARALYPTAN